MVDKLLHAIVPVLTLSLVALVSGYLMGYNDGYDIGRKIGKLDAKFVFKHNGVVE